MAEVAEDPLIDAALRARRGEARGADALDRLLRPRLIRYFASGPWPADEAEDLVQKALTLVFKNLETLEHPERFLAWLFAIARNVRSTEAGRWHARRRVVAGNLDSVGDPPAPREDLRREEEEERARRAAALSEALARLPARQRQCLLLQVRTEMSYEEIAVTLRLSTHTVRNHIFQSRKSLRRLLGRDREEPRA